MSAIYPSLSEKRVVITGGGSGIGACMVEAFARQGAQVFFLDIAQDDARQLEATLKNLARPPKYFDCDLTDIARTQTVLTDIQNQFGAIDVLVNNAANDDRHDIGKLTAEYWDKTMAVNLKHQFFCAQAVLEGMKTAGKGVILNLGSISWHLAEARLSIYMTAKAGIEGLTRGMARDFGGFGIRVNCIVPGAIRTPRQVKLWQTPQSEAKLLAAQCLHVRIDPVHVAAMALFLASDDAARCTGREYYVDAGLLGG